MKKLLAIVTIIGTFATPAWGAVKTVTLAIPGMNCAACPITIKKVLAKIDGVQKAEVSFEKREAVVTFDDARTNVGALSQATGNIGYPSTVKR